VKILRANLTRINEPVKQHAPLARGTVRVRSQQDVGVKIKSLVQFAITEQERYDSELAATGQMDA
jgi:hypothetical protein